MSSNQTVFNQRAKRKLVSGQELTDRGLIWRKRSGGDGTWRYDFTIAGCRHKGVIGHEREGVTLSAARARLAQVRAQKRLEAPRNGAPATPTGIRFSMVLDGYIERIKSEHKHPRQTIARANGHIRATFGHRMAGEITAHDVEDFKTALGKKSLKPATIQHYLKVVSGVFEYLRQQYPGFPNPVRLVKMPRIQQRYYDVFTQDELDMLLLSSNGSCVDHALIAIPIYTGLRASEVLGLAWGNVDLEQGVINVVQTSHEGRIVEETKSGRNRQVWIPKSLKDILIRLQQEGAESELLFTSDGRKPFHHVQRMFARIKRDAGLGGCEKSYHNLRRTFATKAAHKNVPIPMLQKWLGHANITTTMSYIHSSHSESRAEFERMFEM